MYNVKFVGSAVTVPIIISPIETQWKSAHFTEEYCNGYDPFFELKGFFISIEHDCFVVDQMSRLYQSVVEFGGKPPTHWMVHKGKPYAIYQDNSSGNFIILEFKESY